MPLIYRSLKGAPLTFEEVDSNFRELDDRVSKLEESPPDAEGIASIQMEGEKLIFKGTRGSEFGAFQIPKAFWNARGGWKKETSYAPLDVVASQKSLFVCMVGHTSSENFDAIFWQEIFSFSPLLPEPEVPLFKEEGAGEKHEGEGKPEKRLKVEFYEKENLPPDPELGELAFLIEAFERPALFYFDGKEWLSVSDGSPLYSSN